MKHAPGFAESYLVNGAPPATCCASRPLGDTLHTLGQRGLDDFYRGETAARIAAELRRIGSPVRAIWLLGNWSFAASCAGSSGKDDGQEDDQGGHSRLGRPALSRQAQSVVSASRCLALPTKLTGVCGRSFTVRLKTSGRE
ncbi:MAG: gamma-glutamyltransferase [Xanthomonadales bacterium]|nr:gamma-glutamyltransferase [Caldilineaceae bacterium]MCB1601002.1 gamma-glutamyltransferase [Xanthomonadales bacterium]